VLALREPNMVVLTRAMAQKYFGNENPLGQVVRLENKVDLTVTGVVEDVPANSHFRFDFLASFSTLTEDLVGLSPLEQWGVNFGIYTYALLPANLNVKSFEEKIARFYDKHVDPKSADWRKTFLQPLTGIHLYSHLEGEFEPNNYPSNLYIISTIGLLILAIACINFMNLATARSARRAKEVGMRKVLGAVKGQLLKQFLGESLLLAFIAMLLALVLVELLLPEYTALIGKSLHFKYRENWLSLAAIIGMATFVGIISGIYPAFVLSAYKPVETLKGMKSAGQMKKGPLYLKKVLVVTQFAISVFLIAGTLIIKEQLSFFKEANLGFKKDLTVVIPMSDRSISKQYQVIKNEIERLPNVLAVTASFKAPIGEGDFVASLYPKGFEAAQERFQINLNFIDYNFIENFGIKLLAGRNFSPEFTTDFKNAFIVNESTIRKLGFVKAEEALGHKVTIGLDEVEGTIIGVTEDFHIQSLHREIAPLVMMYWPVLFNTLAIKISPNEISSTLERLEQAWSKLAPNFPFQYSFLDESINSLYQAEEKTERIAGTFSMLAIVIACLGLFGLASYATAQRTKEIGIRKVLGASVAGIVNLLSSDFTKLVIAANFIAWPLAWFAMNRWLQDFAYRVEIGWWIFVLAGGLALIIALLTICTQAIKAALANPVEALRYE
jgi:putative ABC transport system permease protein